MIRLSANENPFGVGSNTRQAIHSFMEYHVYVDPSLKDLKQALAKTYGLDPARILCGCGSEDLLFSSIRTLLSAGDDVILPRYGFSIYQAGAKSAQAKCVFIDYDEHWVLKVQSIIHLITPQTKLICLDNPANPIGTYVPFHRITQLLDDIPSHIPVILDAAYAEYVEDGYGFKKGDDLRCGDYQSGLSIVDQYPNVIVTRTFSKAFGLAGLRVGWLYTSQDMIDQLTKNRCLFKTPHLSSVAAIAALADQDFVARTVDYTHQARQDLESLCAHKGILAWSCCANFVMIQLRDHHQVRDFMDVLLRHHIVVKDLNDYGLDRLIRISIGNEAHMTYLKDVIHSIFSDKRSLE